jgi:hypothetical protein
MVKSNRKFLFFYLFFLCLHIALVWSLPYFPTQDGPSHLYNLVILKDLLNEGKEWGEFFSYKFRAVPNLGFIFISYPLLQIFSPLVVEKLFISIYVILIGTSLFLLLNSFNKQSLPFIFFVFPIIFNFNLMMGFYSYVITIPLFLLAFTFSWKFRNCSLIFKFFYYNLAGLTIFFFHVIPFVFFLLSIICITIAQSKGFKRIIRDQAILVTIIFPSLLIFAFYFGKNLTGSIPDFSYLLHPSHYKYLRNDLFFFSTVTFSAWQMLPGFTFTCLFISFLILYARKFITKYYKRAGDIIDFPPSEKVFIYLTLALFLIYLLSPFRFGKGSFFSQRFPWVIFLLLIPLLTVDERIISKRFVFITSSGITIFFLLVNATVFWEQSAKINKFMSGLHTELPKASFVMTYKRRKWEKSGLPRADVLMHAASYYGIFKGCVDIGNYETGLDYFPVHFENNIPSPPSQYQINPTPKTINWSEYPSIQYLFSWDIDNQEKDELNTFFHIIFEDAPFSIWQRNMTDS